MRNHIFLPLMFISLFWTSHYGQTGDQNIKQYIPNVIPPSPSVGNLMKFEEVPVSHYTGVPDINIPIVQLNTGIADLPLSLSLKYHTHNAKSDSYASEVGLGWSLFAGGSISRTVIGSPDEMRKLVTSNYKPNQHRYISGIYFDPQSSPLPDVKNYSSSIINSVILGPDVMNAFAFESVFMNKYDTQYDLYQYNFMNHTGRFIVKKNGLTLTAVKLDRNNLKIEVGHSPVISSTVILEPTSFTITDEHGNTFVFDIVSKSTTKTDSVSSDHFGGLYEDFPSTSPEYNSTYYLSKIQKYGHDYVHFRYNQSSDITVTERTRYTTQFLGIFPPHSEAINHNHARLPRTQEDHVTTINTKAKLLTEIEILQHGKINFDYEPGRQDTNFDFPGHLYTLKTIRLKSVDGNYDEKFELSHVYKQASLTTLKRLFLHQLEKWSKLKSDTNYTSNGKHIFSYGGDPIPGGPQPIGDPGLMTGYNSYYTCSSPLFSTTCASTEVLRSITYPTTGAVFFGYEPNTYTYIPPKNMPAGGITEAEELTNFDANPLNWNHIENQVFFNTFSEGYKKAFTVTGSAPVSVLVEISTSEINHHGWKLQFYNKVGNNYIEAQNLTNLQFLDGIPPASVLMTFYAGDYYCKLIPALPQTPNVTFGSNFRFSFSERNQNNLKYLFDYRGIRVNSISYFDKISITFPPAPADKTVRFSYDDLNDPKKSTGALVFPLPVTEYTEQYKALLEFPFGGTLTTGLFQMDIRKTSSRNFLLTQQTKGSDIGYQYVTRSETGLGKTVFQYTSPRDMPNEDIAATAPPFLPIENYDYKRGNLINKKVYGENSQLLAESSYEYDYPFDFVKTGIGYLPIQKGVDGYYLYGGKYDFYSTYVLDANGNQGAAPHYGTNTLGFIAQKSYGDVVGTALMTKEITTQYFPGSNLVKATNVYEYNSRDYPVKKTSTSADGSVLETTYQYAHEKGISKLITANMISTPVETTVIKKKNSLDAGKTLSKTETLYNDPAHLFPTSVRTFNIQAPTGNHTEVTFDAYDAKGNLLQYTTNGITTVIIWGYNSTQPIAKIEGKIPSMESLQLPIITASDTDHQQGTPTSEQNLRDALDTFRKAVYAETRGNVQITTYTYDPLVGVRSITPPSGIREVYLYDAANRLKEIREQSDTGQLLKEYKYNYKQ